MECINIWNNECVYWSRNTDMILGLKVKSNNFEPEPVLHSFHFYGGCSYLIKQMPRNKDMILESKVKVNYT